MKEKLAKEESYMECYDKCMRHPLSTSNMCHALCKPRV